MNKILVLLLAGASLLFAAVSAKAQILLEINDSNPNDVVITATGNAASTAVTTYISDGVDLIGFFSGNAGVTDTITLSGSSLTVGSATGQPTYVNASSDDLLSVGGATDLNLFNNFTSAQVSFSSSSSVPAFTGELTLNLADLNASSLAPVNGAKGDLYTGDSQSPPYTPNDKIGTWEIVNTVAAPEPSTVSVILITALLLGARLQMKRRAKSSTRIG